MHIPETAILFMWKPFQSIINTLILLLSSRYKIAHATWEHRQLLTLTLQTTCPRAFLCSQLAMTCSIWTRSKKSSCKGSGMSWLKSIESRILKIFLRTANVNQFKLYSEIPREKQNKKKTIGAYLTFVNPNLNVWSFKRKH